MERLKLFFCYYEKYRDEYNAILSMLKRKWHPCDNNSLIGGDSESEKDPTDEYAKLQIGAKIAQSDELILFIDDDTHNLPWIDWEIECAEKKHKLIVGIMKDINCKFPKALDKLYHGGYNLLRRACWCNEDEIVEAIKGEGPPFIAPRIQRLD